MPSQTVHNYSFKQLERALLEGSSPAALLASAQAEAASIRERAHTEGYGAGYAEGLARAREEAAPAISALVEASTAVRAAQSELADVLSVQAGELGLLTAEQIVAAAIAVQPERVVDVARGALRRLSERTRVTLVVHPSTLELLKDATAGLRAELGGIEHLDLQADRRVAPGGAIARTEHGEIDASVAAQLTTARELVAAALAEQGAAPSATHAAGEPASADDD
jgi:flagellar assembly protein FliH